MRTDEIKSPRRSIDCYVANGHGGRHRQLATVAPPRYQTAIQVCLCHENVVSSPVEVIAHDVVVRHARKALAAIERAHADVVIVSTHIEIKNFLTDVPEARVEIKVGRE